MNDNTQYDQIQEICERLQAALATQKTAVLCLYRNPVNTADTLYRIEVMQQEVARLTRLLSQREIG